MKKVSLLLAAFALVIGLSQCKKPNLPVLNIGETQHVVLNASWDNGGSKLDQDGILFKWTIGDKLTVSGAATGNLTCTDVTEGTFEGDITRTSGEKVIFTFKSEKYKIDYMEQTGALNDAVSLTGEAPYSAVGKYDVSMTMPHAVLKLDLSKLGTPAGTPVTIKVVGGDPVASVKNVKNDEASKALYVAVPASPAGSSETKIYEFESSAGTARCADGWALVNNTFYTLTGGTGQAIVVTPSSPELLTGKFSVSATEYVQFSRGNLFCTRSGEGSYSYTFGFESNQYDFRCRNGMTNDKAVIDGATTTTPPSTAGLFLWDIHHAGDFGAFETSLQSGACDPSDVFNWGDAFGPGSRWKTLTATEWEYLLANSMTSATVNGVQGRILRPDGYPAADVRSSYGPSSVPTWDEAEAAGLVFLPAAGYVNSLQVSNEYICAYWTANASISSEAKYYVYWEGTNHWNTVGSMSRAQGAAVRLVQKFEKPIEPTFVDLDLPSGTLWATCNVGADSPEKCGDYFQWGGVTPVTSTSINVGWATCPGNGGYGTYNESAFNTWKAENLTDDILEPTVDAACVNWGGDWRMPTSDDFKELCDNTYNQWIEENGVKGWKFTSKINSGKHIFLPAAGSRYDCQIYDKDTNGLYWSSSLNSSEPDKAYYLSFGSSTGIYSQLPAGRGGGCPVRPVRAAR